MPIINDVNFNGCKVKIIGKARTNDGKKADMRTKDRVLRADGKPDGRTKDNKDVAKKRRVKNQN
tara:strand:+ start:1295 stop:1486 length:192 start_codon:yes stop_codon:yes gene_type:complete